jgi:hypothetical protein
MPFPQRKPASAAKSGIAKPGVKARPATKAKSKPKASRPRRASGLGRARRGTRVLHTCGHKEAHVFTGPKWKKAKDAEWQKGQECTACWSLKQAEEQEALCGVQDLPELDGADRQVSWARSLRAAVIARVKLDAWRLDQKRKLKGLEPATERYLARVLPLVLAKTDSHWWIDNREGDPLELILDFQTLDDLEELRQEAERAVVCPF